MFNITFEEEGLSVIQNFVKIKKTHNLCNNLSILKLIKKANVHRFSIRILEVATVLKIIEYGKAIQMSSSNREK